MELILVPGTSPTHPTQPSMDPKSIPPVLPRIASGTESTGQVIGLKQRLWSRLLVILLIGF